MDSVPGPTPPPDPESAPGPVAAGRSGSRLVRRGGLFVAGAVAMLVALLAYGAIVPARPLTRSDVQGAIASALASVTPPPAYSELVYQAIAPSFVVVQASGGEPDSTGSPAASGAPAASPEASGFTGKLGSGVLVDSNGDILTALHVVAGATTIRLRFADGSQSDATVVTRQPEHDVAVLQAAALPSTAVPATLGNPRSVQVGDEAYVVGNPFGLGGSMTAGIISGLNRSFRNPATGQMQDGLIQFDAAANPGNSGGPLMNRAGQVVGIVTSLVNPTGQDVFIGIGLAVPIDIAGGAAGLPPD